MHASNQIIKNPMIIATDFDKDFSWGFYCTNNYKQAKRWTGRRKGSPTINYYEYTENPDLRVLTFTEMSDEWLNFIAKCRAGQPHDYDIVEGPMADDQIWYWVKLFLEGEMEKEAFLKKAAFLHPTHQICFCTARALRCLKFLRSETVHD